MDPADREPPSFSPARRWAAALSVALGILALLAVTVMLNYLAARHHSRWPLSGQRRVQLSPQSLRVLQTLTNEVKVTVFWDTISPEGSADAQELYLLVSALLREYAQANPRIVVRTLDPSRRPAEADLLLATHRLTSLKDRNFVLLASGDARRVLYQSELADYQIEVLHNEPPREFAKRLVAFRGEPLFTTALFNLANPRQFKVCFTQGHGEHDPERVTHPHGYAKFAAALAEKSNAQWEKLILRGTNEIPADCQLLIIAGPRQTFSDVELARIDNYLRQQAGRLLVLLPNPAYSGRTGIENVLARWNVMVGDKIVLDPPHAPREHALLAAQINEDHPVMKALAADSEELRPLLVLPRAVGPLAVPAPAPDAPKVDVLAATSPNAIEYSDIRDGQPTRNPYLDRPGVFPLITAVEQGSVKGVGAGRGATRIIVVGDSFCLDNELFDNPPANHYFATLAVDWLLDRPQVVLEGIVPQPLRSYQLMMTTQQLRTAQWILLAAVPGGILLFGALVWWRRRH